MNSKIKDFKLNFLAQTIIVFLLISFLSLAAAYSMITGKVVYTSEPVSSVYVPPAPAPPYHPAQIEIPEFLISFFVATLLLLILLELFRGKFLFEIFFASAIIYGSQGHLGIIFAKINAFLASIAITVLRFIYPRIWTQNFAIILAISGIAASLGLAVKPLMAAIILILLSIYDIIAVYKTRHMVKLFKGMAKRGALLALIVPNSFLLWNGKFESITEKNKDEFIFLGTGDLALPLFLAVSVFPYGTQYSLGVIFGACFGLAADHLVFIGQKIRKPIPALPAIALFSIIGCLIVFAFDI